MQVNLEDVVRELQKVMAEMQRREVESNLNLLIGIRNEKSATVKLCIDRISKLAK